MGVRKLSISLDEETADAAREAADAAGLTLSAWLARAAAETAGIEAGLRGVAEFEAENGPIPDEARAWARGVMARHGVGRR